MDKAQTEKFLEKFWDSKRIAATAQELDRGRQILQSRSWNASTGKWTGK